MSEDYKGILSRLLSFPQRSQIKIDFDAKKKLFQFSLPIYSSRGTLPKSVAGYVEARKNHVFKPHSTAFRVNADKVMLVQEIPFQWGFQPAFRDHADQFWQMAKRMHQMLSEIATEEKFKQALYLDSDFQE